MTVLELKEKKLNLQTELKGLIDKGEVEKRFLSDDENSRIAEIKSEVDQIDEELRNIEKENKKIIIPKKMEKEIRLFDLIKGIVNNTLTDEQRAYVNGNTISYRAAIQATVTDHGVENVPQDKTPLEVAIRNASVLNKLNVTYFGNAVGDIKVPKMSNSQVAWAGSENASAADAAGAFSDIVLQPKRLAGYITISKQFLAQSPENAEAIILNDLAAAVAQKIDETVFGAAVGTTTVPEGLFYDTNHTTTGTSLAAVTYDDVLALEAAVEAKNGTDFVFVANPQVKYALKGTQTASGRQMVFEGNEIDGYPAVVSNSVNAKSLLCFVPADLACADWGLDIVVDPYTLASENEIKLVINYLFDAKLKGDRIQGEIFS